MVILPVTGIVIGSIQIGRGIINQPEAIREARKGKFWDLVCLTLCSRMFHWNSPEHLEGSSSGAAREADLACRIERALGMSIASN